MAQPKQRQEEDVLTQNIFELLSCDLQMFILTFLSMQDLYPISLSCKHGEFLVWSPEADGYVWKTMASHLGLNNEVREESALSCVDKTPPPPNMWRELVRSNLMKWDDSTRTSLNQIKMHNNDKTISCERVNKWYTILANRNLDKGVVHGWEYILDEYDDSIDNLYRIFVGIERRLAFTGAVPDKIIGYSSQGIGYNIGEHSVHREHSYQLDNRSILYDEGFKFSSGDSIAIKLDLKNLSNSKTAKMYLFKNNKYFMTISDIPTQDIVYCPAISLINRQRVSIRMRYPSTLDIENQA